MSINNKIIDDFYNKSVSLNCLSNEELKLLNIIKSELYNLDKFASLSFSNNKILLNYQIMLVLSKKDLFKKRSFLAHNLIKKLIKKKLIAKKSILYPKNIKFFSTNPLSDCFLNANMKIVDIFINLYNNFLLDDNLSLDAKLYIYLRIFYIKKLSRKEITLIDENTLIDIPDNPLFVIYEKLINQDSYVPLKILFIDNNIKEFYCNAKRNNSKIFNNSFTEYENQLQKFLKQKNITYSQARVALEFVYQIKNSPLRLNLQKILSHPKITLHEIDYIFPSIIPQNLLEIEKKNIEKYFNSHSEIDEEEEYIEVNDTINNYIQNDFKEYDFLKTVLIFPNDIKKKYKFLDTCYKTLENSQNDFEVMKKIKEYILFILKKTDDRRIDENNNESKSILKISKNIIKLSTARDYLSIAFKYAFNYIVAEGEINNKTISLINNNLKSNEKLTEKSIKKYKRIINLFLLRFTDFNSLKKINSAIDIRRSIVFKKEFEEIVDSIHKTDLEKYNQNKNTKIKSLMQPIFLILLYYSGLRKTELRTRLIYDIKRLNSCDFTIDVNIKGFKETMKSTGEIELKLKTSNSRRRVRFTITNQIHLKMLNEYLNWLEKNNYKFLFPLISENGSILKKHVSKDSFFSKLSLLIQKHTKRYTTIHSLRHTFATRYFLENIKSKKIQTMMYELTNFMGHSDPQITIDNYIHHDFLNISFKDVNDYF